MAGLGVDLGTAPRIVNAAGKYVLPGAIDVHTHFEMPFMGTFTTDDSRTGTAAAAAGGITTVVDWAIQEPGESLFTTLEKWDKKAAGKAVIDYSFHVVLTDLSRNALDEIKDVVRNGIGSFKCFMGLQGHAPDVDRTVTSSTFWSGSTWPSTTGLVPALQGPISSKVLGGADLSWLVGIVVAGGVYLVVGRRVAPAPVPQPTGAARH